MRTFRADKLTLPQVLQKGAPARECLERWLQADYPLDLEIGCGVGFHPLQAAHREPRRNLIAVERTAEKYLKFERRYGTHGCPANLLPLHADGVAVVACALPTDSISRVYLLYPNPYPKNPAARWMRMPFMATLLDRLKAKGEIWMATNIASYAEEAKQFAHQQWQLNLVEETHVGSKEVGSALTHFEKKYLQRGETCIRLRWQKA